MKTKIFATIDTNVLISSIISQHGSPAEVLNLVETGNITSDSQIDDITKK